MSAPVIQSVRFLRRVWAYLDGRKDDAEARELSHHAWAYLQLAARARDWRTRDNKKRLARRARRTS